MNLTMKDIKVGDEFKQIKALGRYLFEDMTFVVDDVEEDKSAILLFIKSEKNTSKFFFGGTVYLSLNELNEAFEKVKKFIWSDWETCYDKEYTYCFKTNGRITFVKIKSEGKNFKGKATCHKDDWEVFDKTIGINLAYERAVAKLTKCKTDFKPGDRVQYIENTESLYIYSNATGTVLENCEDGTLYVFWDRGCCYDKGGLHARKWYVRTDHVKQIKNNFNLEMVKGDIFTAPINYTLLHTTYGESKGEAVGLTKAIIEAFDIKEDLRDELEYLLEVSDYYSDNENMVGDIVTYNCKNVITLISKRCRHDKVSYEAIEKGLTKLKNFMEDNDIHYLAMPTICCGHEGLEWEVVEDIIYYVFSNCKIPITIKVYEF